MTDASLIGIGVWIGQELSMDDIHPTAFYLKKFKSAKMNYSVTDKETLAVIDRLMYFELQLSGTKFISKKIFTLEIFGQAWCACAHPIKSFCHVTSYISSPTHLSPYSFFSNFCILVRPIWHSTSGWRPICQLLGTLHPVDALHFNYFTMQGAPP